jgi:hypothetical protein
MNIDRATWDGVMLSIANRLAALEATEADYDAVVAQLQSQALAVITATITDEINAQRVNLTQLENDFGLFEAAFNQLIAGGVDADQVVLDAIAGLTATDVQSAFAEVLGNIPVKASAAEVTTGEDNAKFVTPAALSGLSVGGKAEFTATGAITAGDPVALNDDGTISVVGNTVVAANAGTPVQFTTSDIDNPRIVYDTVNNRVVIVYRDITNSSNIYSVVGTVSGTSISFGTPVAVGTIAHNKAQHDALVYVPSLGKLLVCYGYNNSLRCAVGTVSGTSITWGAENNITLSEITSRTRLVYDDATDTVVVFYDQTTADDLYAALVTISGDTVTLGTPLLINESAADNWIWAAAGNGTVFIIYEAGSNDSFARLIKIDGSTLTATTAENFSPFEAWGWAATGYTNFNTETGMVWHPDEQCFVAVWVRSNDVYAFCIYPSLDGKHFDVTRPFPVGIAARADTSQYSLWPCYNPNTNRISVVYQDHITFYATSLELKVEKGMVSEGTRTILNAEDSTHCCGVYDPDSGNVVVAYWDDADGDRGQALVFTAPATHSNARKWIGIASETVADGAECKVDIVGGVNESQTGLTPSADYYLADDGSLTTDRTPYKVGKALSATEILIGGEA